jgi:TetR/AcrR family tetracycline transcriptional repressor
MRMLGTRLGVDPMAIYHYFPNRTALLDGVVERIFSEVRSPDLTGDWRVDASASVHAFRQTVLAHPAAIPLMAMRPAVTPAAFAPTETLLEALAPAGLSPREAFDAAQSLGRLTMGHVIAQGGPPPGADRDGREAAHAAGYAIDHDELFAGAVDAALTGLAPDAAARPPG